MTTASRLNSNSPLYGKWSTQVLLQHRIVLHLLPTSFALIVFILLCVVLLDAIVRGLENVPPSTGAARILFALSSNSLYRRSASCSLHL